MATWMFAIWLFHRVDSQVFSSAVVLHMASLLRACDCRLNFELFDSYGIPALYKHGHVNDCVCVCCLCSVSVPLAELHVGFADGARVGPTCS